MSSAKAALESDTRVLAYEAGRKWGVRVNTISAGPLGSRAAKAIGFIDDMIKCAAIDQKGAKAGSTCSRLQHPCCQGRAVLVGCGDAESCLQPVAAVAALR